MRENIVCSHFVVVFFIFVHLLLILFKNCYFKHDFLLVDIQKRTIPLNDCYFYNVWAMVFPWIPYYCMLLVVTFFFHSNTYKQVKNLSKKYINIIVFFCGIRSYRWKNDFFIWHIYNTNIITPSSSTPEYSMRENQSNVDWFVYWHRMAINQTKPFIYLFINIKDGPWEHIVDDPCNC